MTTKQLVLSHIDQWIMMEQQHRMIRLLLNTFGILGVQLRPLQWNNVLSILNWSLNNLIIVATLYLLNDQ